MAVATLCGHIIRSVVIVPDDKGPPDSSRRCLPAYARKLRIYCGERSPYLQILFTMKTITQMITIVPTIPYPNISLLLNGYCSAVITGLEALWDNTAPNSHVYGR
jgi:hypothetical protein